MSNAKWKMIFSLPLHLCQQLLFQIRGNRFEHAALGQGRFTITDLKIRQPKIVISLGLLGLQTRRLFVGSNSLGEAPSVVVSVAQFVVGLGRVRTKLNRVLISADRFVVAALFDLAIADLNPCLWTARIPIGGRLEIAERAVIISQPQRIDSASVP